jgi:hypothetical protein
MEKIHTFIDQRLSSFLLTIILTAMWTLNPAVTVGQVQGPGEVLDSQTFESPIPENQERFGISVANLGDVNGDGVNDVAVGAVGNAPGNEDRPSDHVWIVFMGENGQSLTTPTPQRIPMTTPSCGDIGGNCRTGFMAEGIGDLDGDGIPDLALGVPTWNTAGNFQGAVNILFLNSDGTVRDNLIIDNTDFQYGAAWFGGALAHLADIDNDPSTKTALAVLSPDFVSGTVTVLFLDDDGEVVAFEQLFNIGNQGGALANVGDVNADGVPDLAVSDPEVNDLHILFLNNDGTLYDFSTIDGRGGRALAGIDDLDGDGVPDMAVENGADTDLLFLNRDGTVKDTRVLSGLGAESAEITFGPDLGGEGLESLGDLAGDGSSALAVGDPVAEEVSILFLETEPGETPIADLNEITYTDLDPEESAVCDGEVDKDPVEIDFDQDGNPEFSVVSVCNFTDQWLEVASLTSGSDVGMGVVDGGEVDLDLGPFRDPATAQFSAAKLDRGTVVAPTDDFVDEAGLIPADAEVTLSNVPMGFGREGARAVEGPWMPNIAPGDPMVPDISRGYLGVKMQLDGNTHFGWIRVDQVMNDPDGFGEGSEGWSFVVKDYAYAVSSNTGIRTGDRPPIMDPTPPVCGSIDIERNDEGRIVAVNTTATDEESGIERADFLRLNNIHGLIDIFNEGPVTFNGEVINVFAGPFSEDDVVDFDPGFVDRLYIRGERIRFDEGGAIVVRVTNGAGQFSDCDPVTTSLVAEAPESFGLEPSYPNPFRTATTIPFRIAEPGHVRLTVYDALGREVARLVDREMAAGAYEVQWSAPRLASGTYFYRVEAGSFRATRRVSIVR